MRRRPWAVIAAVLATPLVLALALQAVGGGLSASRPLLALAAEAVFALVALGGTALLGWWRESGLTDAWRRRPLLLLAAAPPALVWLVATPLLLTGHARWQLLPVLVPLVALVGFSEELSVRGLVLYGLRGLGPLGAGLAAAAVFGFLHFINLTARPLGPTSLQVVAAFQIGLLFAALRLRMGTLWPLIASHALFDLAVLLLAPLPHPKESWAFTLLGSLIVYSPFGLTGLGLLLYDQLEGRFPWRPRPRPAIG
ncbi:MAG TPA: CPBP family intramembrane glutamic endopeptidase [Candidatus Dormibacteraeota bacterium]